MLARPHWTNQVELAECGVFDAEATRCSVAWLVLVAPRRIVGVATVEAA